MTPLRVLVVGAGAVGGYFGALLADAGHDVTFLARGATLAALRADGLVVERPGGALRLPRVRVVADAAAAPRPALVLACVKSYDTAAAAAQLRPVVDAATVVLSLQNGIENEAVLADALGLPPLLVGLTRIAVERIGPAPIRYSGRGEIDFGEPDGAPSARAARVAAALAAAGIPHRLRDDVLVAAWEKLAWNAGFNAVTTLADASVGEVLTLPATRALVEAAMAEVDAVATTRGVAVRRWRLRRVLEESAREMPDFATSMLQDRRAGRRLEHDAISGAVVRAAAASGVAVPVNGILLALLARLDPHAR